MKYRVNRTCVGFRGQMWEAGQIVEVNENEVPPSQFVPVDETPVEQPKPVPHRTEAQEVPVGKSLPVIGGMSAGLENDKIDRIMTTDKVPNNVEVPVKKTRRKRKDVGSVKKSD